MRKDVKYIQLPPISEDIETPALEVIWLIAKMNQDERKDALEQMKVMLGDEGTGEMDYDTIQEILEKYGNSQNNEVFKEYIECIRRLLARLVMESYDVAAYVYQKHCVEKQSIEEMLKTTRLSEASLEMFVKYFDVRESNIEN